MARPTFSARVIVVRKRKLAETDLILTMVARDGSRIEAVAKGARKPTSSFASRLELFSEADVLIVEGRSLGIVKEVRLVSSCQKLREDIYLTSCGAVVAEALDRTTYVGLSDPRVFLMTEAVFQALSRSTNEQALVLVASFLVKLTAQLGFGPMLNTCVSCGAALPQRGSIFFSYVDGGARCAQCGRSSDAISIDASVIAWAYALLHMTFSDISSSNCPSSVAIEILLLYKQWMRIHGDVNLRSIDYLISQGI